MLIYLQMIKSLLKWRLVENIQNMAVMLVSIEGCKKYHLGLLNQLYGLSHKECSIRKVTTDFVQILIYWVLWFVFMKLSNRILEECALSIFHFPYFLLAQGIPKGFAFSQNIFFISLLPFYISGSVSGCYTIFIHS